MVYPTCLKNLLSGHVVIGSIDWKPLDRRRVVTYHGNRKSKVTLYVETFTRKKNCNPLFFFQTVWFRSSTGATELRTQGEWEFNIETESMDEKQNGI